MQKLSSVFKEAKKYLWDGKGDCNSHYNNEFICHAIRDTTNFTSTSRELVCLARKIIEHRLGEDRGGARTVTDYLHDVLGLHYEELTRKKVQKYRKDWLTSLEKEFKEIERRFPKGVHHLDGDKNNWDLGNLVGVEN